MRKHSLIICAVILVLAIFVNAQTNNLASSEPKILLDNDKIKVTEYDSNPLESVCGKGKHSHGAHLTILLTEASVKMTNSQGKTMEQKVPAGTAFWSEAETHTVVNNGTNLIKAFIIETK